MTASLLLRRVGRFRGTVAALLVVAVLGGGAAASATSSTEAAWSDRTYVSAPVSAGTWNSGNSCTALNNGGNVVGNCTVTSIKYTETGTAGNHTRTYSVTFGGTTSAAKSIRLSIDLSSGTGTTTGTGAWIWTNAATLVPAQNGAAQFTPTSTCVSLPLLGGVTTSAIDAGAAAPVISFALTDNRSGTAANQRTCG
jgi:hypothetical protein